jgi:Mrp family chromosome partitioning ATPase
VLIFATSDTGGTGRSVTTSNVAHRAALLGRDVCDLDFDFNQQTVDAFTDVAERIIDDAAGRG